MGWQTGRQRRGRPSAAPRARPFGAAVAAATRPRPRRPGHLSRARCCASTRGPPTPLWSRYAPPTFPLTFQHAMIPIDADVGWHTVLLFVTHQHCCDTSTSIQGTSAKRALHSIACLHNDGVQLRVQSGCIDRVYYAMQEEDWPKALNRREAGAFVRGVKQYGLESRLLEIAAEVGPTLDSAPPAAQCASSSYAMPFLLCCSCPPLYHAWPCWHPMSCCGHNLLHFCAVRHLTTRLPTHSPSKIVMLHCSQELHFESLH